MRELIHLRNPFNTNWAITRGCTGNIIYVKLSSMLKGKRIFVAYIYMKLISNLLNFENVAKKLLPNNALPGPVMVLKNKIVTNLTPSWGIQSCG